MESVTVTKNDLLSGQSSREDRLSFFGQRLQSLTETFYSNILDDCQEKRIVHNAQDFEGLHEIRSNDFTFDECSMNEMKSKDEFSFTFHSNDQSQRPTRSTNPIQTRAIRPNLSSTPHPNREESLSKKNSSNETIVVGDKGRQAILLGYYPVVTYQPVVFPPMMYLSEQSISDPFSRAIQTRTMNNK